MTNCFSFVYPVCKDSNQSREAEGGKEEGGQDVTQLFVAGMMLISSIT